MDPEDGGDAEIVRWLRQCARMGTGPARAIRTYPPLVGVKSLVPAWAKKLMGKDVAQFSALFAWLRTEEAQAWLKQSDNLSELMTVLGELVG